MRPKPRVRNKKAHERSHHGHTGNHPAFPAQWFYGFLRALPGDRACLSPSSAELYSANLTPASRRQDHTTSPSASSALVSPGGRDRIVILLFLPRRQDKFRIFRNWSPSGPSSAKRRYAQKFALRPGSRIPHPSIRGCKTRPAGHGWGAPECLSKAGCDRSCSEMY